MPDRPRYRHPAPIDPADEAPKLTGASSAAGHTHVTPKRSQLGWQIAVTFLLATTVYVGFLNWSSDQRITELESYVADAKVYRDGQAAELADDIDAAVCAVMDRLPAGPLWDPVREEHGCGPGIDPAAFDPGQVQALLNSYGMASLPRTGNELYALMPEN